MSQNPFLPRFKDQVASVLVERCRSPPKSSHRYSSPTNTSNSNNMSQNPYLPRFKDQVASVPAERRRSLSNRDPDGTLLAAEDGTLLAARSHRVSTARQAKPVESPRNNDNVRAPPSPAAEATATLMAFDVVAVEDSTTENSNNDPLAFAVVDDEESISVGTSPNNNDIVPNINRITAMSQVLHHRAITITIRKILLGKLSLW